MERNIMNGHYDMCKEKGAPKIQCAQLNCELHTVKMPPKAGNLLYSVQVTFLEVYENIVAQVWFAAGKHHWEQLAHIAAYN